MYLAPIVLFVYNRPYHTLETIKSLLKNDMASISDLYIYSDGPKAEKDVPMVNEVRKVISNIEGFKSVIIIESPLNKGLAKSVIEGVSYVINKYGKAIVVEDDIKTAPGFLKFHNECLEFYKSNNQVFSISGYSLPVQIPISYPYDAYFSYRGSSWGWSTWDNRWNNIRWDVGYGEKIFKNIEDKSNFAKAGEDLLPMLKAQIEGRIDSWAIRFAYDSFVNNSVHVTPVVSLASNIGQDGTGIHSGKTNKYNVILDNEIKNYRLPREVFIDSVIEKRVSDFFKKNFLRKAAFRLYKIIFLFNKK